MTMTTSMASLVAGAPAKRGSPAGQHSLQRIEVILFWRGEAPWAPLPVQEAYTFRCLGARFGRTRWQLHLAQMDRRLPGMSTGQRRALATVLQEALAERTGLDISQFSTDLILDARD